MLQKQPVNINFSGGLDTKTDPYQVSIGSFLRLQNSVFTKGGRLTKRNGFGPVTNLPQAATSITTFNGNLTAIGNSIQAFVEGPNSWVNKGNYYPMKLSVLPLIRSNSNQTQLDSVISANNLVCTVFTDVSTGSTVYKYVVADSTTGQNVLPPVAIPSNGTVTNAPRVFLLNQYFIIVFGSVVSAVNHLQYVKINSTTPVAPTSAVDISTSFSPSTTLAFDGVVANNTLYLAWNGADGGGAIRMTGLTATLTFLGTKVFSSKVATMISVCSDLFGVSPNIWVSFWDSGSTNGFSLLVDQALNTILAPTQILTTTVISNITSTAYNGVNRFLYEIPNNYTYDSSIPTHYIVANTITSTGTVGTPSTLSRSVGLASKAFLYNNSQYVLTIYFSNYQPSYFLLNQTGEIVCKLAYSNAGAYRTTGLPNAIVTGTVAAIGYQFKDLIEAVNKTQGVVNTAGVYSQTGLNLAYFDFSVKPLYSEIGSNLLLTGGFLWGYDGYSLTENGFFVWPDNVEVSTSGSGGLITAQQYFYQALYEWTDNQGNIHRSAPSVPVSVTTTGSTSTNTVNIPTLRLTYKRSNPVKIVVYRWSTGQQNYYQVTSITSPLLNNPAVDYVVFTDTLADSSILGNSLIYTTGGVIENISAPACNSITLFDSRLWIIDSEDPNLLWYSKQVIEATPVEMSDLFTYYTAPTTGSQSSTGDTLCIAPLDDKLIVFKKDAEYYINGSGPDNTGANSQYSQLTFITSTVGCSNQASILLMQEGLMFQSDKGIWLLNRGLGTEYIGAPVEDLATAPIVLSAVNVPETTQVRFTMDSNITLMYDYFYKQWGTFVNVPAISSTLYQGKHTYLNSFSEVLQETAGIYLDNGNPTLQGFTTSWINVAGLQGYQRAYFLYLLGTYISPHTLNVQLAYDYDSNPTQLTVINPPNYSAPWGTDTPWGGSQSWGETNGYNNIEAERVFLDQERCSAVQIIIDEVFDPSFGTIAGAGLTLSGLNMVIGVKRAFRTQSAVKST